LLISRLLIQLILTICRQDLILLSVLSFY